MNNHFISITVLAFSFLLPTHLRAMDEEIIKPCSREECRQILKEFEEKGCGRSCRKANLEKLADKFDPKKDTLFLRALLCADKKIASDFDHHSLTDIIFSIISSQINKVLTRENKGSKDSNELAIYRAATLPFRKELPSDKITPKEYMLIRGNYATERDLFSNRGICYMGLDFINKAMRNNNLPFMQTFFKLFSNNGSTQVAYEVQGTRLDELYYDQELALASEDMTKLVLKNVARKASTLSEAIMLCKEDEEVVLRDGQKKSPKLPGCNYFNQVLNAENRRKLDELDAWNESLRQVGSNQKSAYNAKT